MVNVTSSLVCSANSDFSFENLIPVLFTCFLERLSETTTLLFFSKFTFEIDTKMFDFSLILQFSRGLHQNLFTKIIQIRIKLHLTNFGIVLHLIASSAGPTVYKNEIYNFFLSCCSE